MSEEVIASAQKPSKGKLIVIAVLAIAVIAAVAFLLLKKKK